MTRRIEIAPAASASTPAATVEVYIAGRRTWMSHVVSVVAARHEAWRLAAGDDVIDHTR